VTTTTVLLIRHGETDWARDRLHTGRSDLPLNATGEAHAGRLRSHLEAAGLSLDAVTAAWTSPLERAVVTARRTGLACTVDPDLLEWDYGAAEGRSTAEIRTEHPGWDIWDHGVQVLGGGGETIDQVGARVEAVIGRARAVPGLVALVGHAHALRILTARWLGLAPAAGRHLTLDPAGWAILGWERETPVVERWNPPVP
jgi:probable phosphoglycerate mutase